MLKVEIVHKSGKRYFVPADQVVVYADCGDPVAVTYEHGGVIVHSDMGHKDFPKVCSTLKITRRETKGE